MSKHISLFDTEVDYQAEVFELEYPNVSLVEDTGKIVTKKNVVDKFANVRNAPFGSIILTDTNDNSLIYANPDYYNLTRYPLNRYFPIAIQIVDFAHYLRGVKPMLLSTYYASSEHTGYITTNTSKSNLNFGLEDVTIDASKYNFNTSYKNKFKSINYIKQLIEFDETKTTFDNSISPAWDAVLKFAPAGTEMGDWTLPNYISTLNIADIQTAFSNLKQKVGKDFCVEYVYSMCYDTNENKVYSMAGTWSQFINLPRTNQICIQPCIILN